MTATTCADCGKTIFLVRPGAAVRWAHQFGKAWIYTCRFTMAEGRLLTADYHHPANEEQMHFVAQPKGTN